MSSIMFYTDLKSAYTIMIWIQLVHIFCTAKIKGFLIEDLVTHINLLLFTFKWKSLRAKNNLLPVNIKIMPQPKLIFVTGSGKTSLIATITDIHFLPVRESCTHGLPRNTKYLIIDGQVCFYRRLFTDAVKPPGCISWPWRALMGYQAAPHGSLGLPCGFYQSVSHAEGTALLLESK